MDKLNYHKCDLVDECVQRYLKSFAVTLDAVDYVPKPYLKKILKYIFKNMKRHFRKVNGADRAYQRKLLKSTKEDIMKKLRIKLAAHKLSKKDSTAAAENGTTQAATSSSN